MTDLPRPSKRADRAFFSLAGLWFVALTFVGFAPSFFLRTSPDPLPTHLVVHGIVYSAWVVLFFVQALLISTKHVRLHMTLGMLSVVVLLLMIPTGFHVVLVPTAAGSKTIDEAGFNLSELTVGFAAAFAGLAFRRKPFIHKRLMLFATMMLTVAAADRVALIVGLEELRLFRKLLAVTPAIALVAFDAIRLRRLPLLSLSLLAIAWLILWYTVSDFIFMHPAGESITAMLTRIFVW